MSDVDEGPVYIKEEPADYDAASDSNVGSEWGSEYDPNISVAVKIDTTEMDEEENSDYEDNERNKRSKRVKQSPIRRNPLRSNKGRRSYAEDVKLEVSSDDEFWAPSKPSRASRHRRKRTPEDGETSPKRKRVRSSPQPGVLTESQLKKKKSDGTITPEELHQLREIWRSAWVTKKRHTKRKPKPKRESDKPKAKQKKVKAENSSSFPIIVNGVSVPEGHLRRKKKQGTLTCEEDIALKAHYREQAQLRRAKLRETETDEQRGARLLKERDLKRIRRQDCSSTTQIKINGTTVAEGHLRRKKKDGTLTPEEDAALKRHYREQAQQRRAKMRQNETDEQRELRLARERESKRRRRSENPDYKEMERQRYIMSKASRTEEERQERRQKGQLKRLMMTDEERQIEKFRNLVNRTERLKRMTDEEKKAIYERQKQRRLERAGGGRNSTPEGRERLRRNLRNYYQRMTDEKREMMRRQMRRKYHERLGALQNNPKKWEEAEKRYEESERMRQERGIPKAVSLRFLNIPDEEKKARSNERKEFMKSMRKAYETVRGHKFYPIRITPEMQQLIDGGMTINQARSVLEPPEEREKRLRNQRFTAAKQRLKRKLAKVGATPEEVRSQLAQLAETYDGGTWLQRPYKPHATHKAPAKYKPRDPLTNRKFPLKTVATATPTPPTPAPEPPPPPSFQSGLWPQQYRYPPMPPEAGVSSLLTFPPAPQSSASSVTSTGHDVKYYDYEPQPSSSYTTPSPHYPPQVVPMATPTDASSDYADMSDGGGDFEPSSDEEEPEPPPPTPPPVQKVEPEPPQLTEPEPINPMFYDVSKLMPPPPPPRPPGKRGPKRKIRDWTMVKGRPRRGPIPSNAGKPVERDVVCDICGRMCISTSIHLHKRYNHNPHWVDRKCALCNIPFKTVCLFDRHYTETHGEMFPKVTPYKRPRKRGTGRSVDRSMYHDGVCDMCGKTMFKCLLKRHKYMYHGDGALPEHRIRCKHETCVTRFRDPASLKRHYINVHGEAGLVDHHTCSRCPAKFDTNELLSSHVEEVHPDQFFRCTYCTLFRYTKESLKFHVVRCNRGPKNPTAIIDESLMNVIPSDGLTAKCELCDAPLCVRALAKHYMTMHGIKEEKVPCGYCEREFQCRKAHIEHLDFKHGLSQEQLLEVMSKLRVNNREGKSKQELMELGGKIPPRNSYTRVGLIYKKKTPEELAAAREHRNKYNKRPEKIKRKRRPQPPKEGAVKKSRKGMKYKKKEVKRRGKAKVKKEESPSSEEEWSSGEEVCPPPRKRKGASDDKILEKHKVEQVKRLVIVVKRMEKTS